jgi:hypothetical protein
VSVTGSEERGEIFGGGMTGGSGLSEREGKRVGWVGSGQSGPAGLPRSAQWGSWPLSFLFFFFCFPFLLF